MVVISIPIYTTSIHIQASQKDKKMFVANWEISILNFSWSHFLFRHTLVAIPNVLPFMIRWHQITICLGIDSTDIPLSAKTIAKQTADNK